MGVASDELLYHPLTFHGAGLGLTMQLLLRRAACQAHMNTCTWLGAVRPPMREGPSLRLTPAAGSSWCMNEQRCSFDGLALALLAVRTDA
jgi:hypothetical protein